jgi:hypothetical protein
MSLSKLARVPYFLVVLKAGPASDEEPKHADAHVAFIDSLIERRLVFLGGDFSEPVDGIAAAYLFAATRSRRRRRSRPRIRMRSTTSTRPRRLNGSSWESTPS